MINSFKTKEKIHTSGAYIHPKMEFSRNRVAWHTVVRRKAERQDS